MAYWFCSVFTVVCDVNVCRSELIDSAWVVVVPGQKCIKKIKKITIQVWKTQHGNKTFENNLKNENNDDDECNKDNDQYIFD